MEEFGQLSDLLKPLGPLASVIAFIYFRLYSDIKDALKSSEDARNTERMAAQSALNNSYEKRIEDLRETTKEQAANRAAIDATRVAVETLSSMLRDRTSRQ